MHPYPIQLDRDEVEAADERGPFTTWTDEDFEAFAATLDAETQARYLQRVIDADWYLDDAERSGLQFPDEVTL